MKLTPYVEKLHASPEFKQFHHEHPDASLVAGFFVFDYEGGKNTHQLDYYVPKQHKVAAFTLDHTVQLQLLDLLKKEVPEPVHVPTSLDLGALKGILEEEMKNRMMTESITKLIAVLQTVKGTTVWNLNCVLSGMGILKATIEDKTASVLKMDKSSIMDYIRKIPGSALQHAATQAATKTGTNLPAPTKATLQNELKRLDELEKKIDEEKAVLKKEMLHASDKK